MEINTISAEGVKEKRSVALNSVLAAVLLTSTKIVVGLLTGSLGILAEAAHSGLDLVAAFMTYVAVKMSSKPADSQHTYGHGKIENLSALFEALLLLATCAWIVYEAIHRLTVRHADVDANVWSFAVMAGSIFVDITRSRMLYRTAKKYNSQALEADALHFSTDIWSSSVVILGLICVLLSRYIPELGFLTQADSIAALLVVAIVVVVSIRLGIRTIQALIDTSCSDDDAIIRGVLESNHFKEVCGYHKLRHRHSGGMHFVDFHLIFPRETTVAAAHDVATEIEASIATALGDAGVMAHIEPCKRSDCPRCRRDDAP